MGNILSALLEGVINSFLGWWKAEQGEAAKWTAKAQEQQLASMKEGMQKEAALQKAAEKAKKEAATSGAAWNSRQMLPILLTSTMILPGCFRFYVYTEPYQPVPPKIERPTLDDAPFTEREQALATYASQLEAVNAMIRAEAIKSNTQNGYPIPSDGE